MVKRKKAEPVLETPWLQRYDGGGDWKDQPIHSIVDFCSPLLEDTFGLLDEVTRIRLEAFKRPRKGSVRITLQKPGNLKWTYAGETWSFYSNTARWILGGLRWPLGQESRVLHVVCVRAINPDPTMAAL